MAKRGRPAKSHALRVLGGNAGKRKLPPADTTPLAPGTVTAERAKIEVASLPVPPAPRHLDKLARAEWTRLAAAMVGRGLLRALDLASFEMRCATYSRWRKAKAAVNRKGLTYESNGVVRIRPEVRISDSCEKAMRAWDSEYGLTPAARARVAHVTGEGQRQPALPGIGDTPASTGAAKAPAPHTVADPATMADDEFFKGPASRVH